MKRRPSLLAFPLSLALAACACSRPTPPPTGAPPPAKVVAPAESNPDAALAVAGSVNAMGLDLYAKERGESGNLVFSPASIGFALGMLYGGAATDTHDKMARALHFADTDLLAHDDAAVHQGFAGLLARAVALDGDHAKLRIANRIWAQNAYGFARKFLALTRDQYGAEAENVDFSADPDGIRKRINLWVEDHTNKRIVDLLPVGSIDASTIMVLANAIWFKGTWATKFDTRLTTTDAFTRADGSSVQATMMHQHGPARFGKVGNVRVLELAYAGSDLAMTLVLDDGSIGDLEAKLTVPQLSTWLAALREQDEVDVALPRFEVTRSVDLKQRLADLGLGILFTHAADLSGLLESGNKGPYVSGAFHKAFVTVNEEGAEAAAATAIVITESAARAPLEFHANRPFVWMIRDKKTGLILFLGRVSDPTAKE